MHSVYKQSGISLVELMISVALGLALMSGVLQVFLSNKNVYTTQQGMSRIQENGRLAMEFMSKDVRIAGYFGCHRPLTRQILGADLDMGGLHTDFNQGVFGYDSFADLPNGVVADLGAGINPVPLGNTANILVVRSASQAGVPVSAINTNDSVFGYANTGLTNGCLNGICPGSAAMISDCSKARIFQAFNVGVAANLLTVDHFGGWGGGVNPLENFINGEIMPVNTTVYFLALGANGNPSLWQKTNNDDPLELFEGVEQMRITYARGANSDYELASALGPVNWPDVTSVRIELVARSLQNNVLDESQPYTFAGVPVIPAANDRFLRQVFSTTVGIRSRGVFE